MSEENTLADRFHNNVLPIFVAKTLTAPLEVLKLNMQVQNFSNYFKLIYEYVLEVLYNLCLLLGLQLEME
jgi:hypothetical protein